ncbi:hypothetical protein [Kiloniella sp.]|uniref:hypothetical protein n=1 Tax=Kiloniella sp. TaxID=1938587 RepID=UPI003B0257CF
MSSVDQKLSPTEIQWLSHTRICDQSGLGMKAYAEAHDLDLKDFYHHKGELVKKGLFAVTGVDENLHRVLSGSEDIPVRLHCLVILRNGLEVNWPVSGRTSDLTSIVNALEGV